MNLLGGMGTLYGPIIGAIVFLFAKDLISSYTEHWRIILGIIFVAFVIYSPQGIVGLSRTVRERLTPGLVPLIGRRMGRKTGVITSHRTGEDQPNPEQKPSPELKQGKE